MKISTKLSLISSLSLLTLLALFFISIQSYSNFQNAKNNQELTSFLKNKYYISIEIMDEYLLYQDEFDLKELQSIDNESDIIINKLSNLIKHQSKNSSFNKLIVAKNGLNNVFKRIVANEEKLSEKNQKNLFVYSELNKRLISQLKLKSHDYRINLDQINSQFEEKLDATYKDLILMLTILIISLSVMVIFISIQLNSLVIKRLKILHDGADIISKGQLDYRIEANGNDEFTILANSINSMTENLKNTVEELHSEKVKTLHTLRLASLGEFSAGIAHEINNPLMIIKGFTQLLKRKMAVEESSSLKIIEIVDKIDSTSNRIDRIIKGLKGLTRNAESDPFTLTSAQKIVDDLIPLWEEKFKFNEINFSLNYSENDIFFECSPTQISQVLMNLIGNAFDVVFESKEKWITIDIKLSKNNHNVEFSVTDSAQSMSDEVKSKIMQPFFTTKEVGKGTGLGLSISRSIIEKHKGKLYLDNTSQNTRFVFEIPLRQSTGESDKNYC